MAIAVHSQFPMIFDVIIAKSDLRVQFNINRRQK